MADLLSIGSSGINVYQRALATVSNNIANLNTEGYSRQTTEIRQNQPTEAGNGYIGTGAYFDRVSRQYDGFLESSLQQATADLGSQNSSVEYASRLLDILGDEDIGLTSALTKFFASAKNLSTDPASTALRGAMLRDADALGTRFNALASQLKDLGDQSLSAMEADVRAANALATQLAEINRQMLRQSSESAQAPELLDRRDQLLRDLSEYVQIKTSFDSRGSVTVSVTNSPTKGVILSGTKFSALSVNPMERDPSQLEYKLQGELTNETLTGLQSGSISGYAGFYGRTLTGVTGALNQLARVFVDEVNQVQTTGLDSQGNLGTNFFEIVPAFDVNRGASSGDFQVAVDVLDIDNYQPESIIVAFDGSQNRWYGTTDSGQATFASESGVLDFGEILVQVSGSSSVGDRFVITPDVGAARGLTLALDRADQIATSSLFRVTPGSGNNGIQNPDVSYLAPAMTSQTQIKLEDLTTPRPVVIQPSMSMPVTEIPAGQSEITLAFNPDSGADLSLQILTTDGRHLVGTKGGEFKNDLWLNSLPQFEKNATYDTTYLNQTGLDGYKKLDIIYGNRAEAVAVSSLLPINGLFFEAPFGTDFQGGGLDITLEPATLDDRLGLNNSAFADSSIGEVSSVDNIIYLGTGSSAEPIAHLETIYDGQSQTLRIRFLEENTISDELAARVASLVTFNNGEDLSDSNKTLKKRITVELFDQSFNVNLTQGIDFVTSDLVDAGQITSSDQRYIAKLLSGDIEYLSGTGRVLIDDGDLVLNGVSLRDLTIGESGVLSATDVKTWLDQANTGISVLAQNTIEVVSDQLQLESSSGLKINGHEITSLVLGSNLTFDSQDDLINSINASSSETGVFARRRENGDLILQNLDLGGENIAIDSALVSSGTNALGITSRSYVGNIVLELEAGDPQAIQFSLGPDGTPADLNRLGLDTQIQIRGDIDENLLVFAEGSGQAQLSATHTTLDQPIVEGLRSRQFQFNFVSANRIQITDLTTQTVVGERTYQGELQLEYQGIQISLDQPGSVGDVFTVDGNNLGPNGAFDGQGNNSNILKLVDLESKNVMDGGLTFSEGYLSFVGDVGNLATQSEIARDALEIVQTQAIEARDRVSGVNLDKEAADLIRFQQAYQASAQVMQVASKLFDAVLQVR